MKPKIGDTVQFKKSGITGTVEKILRGTCVIKTPVSRLTAWPEDLIICGHSEVSLEKEMEEHQKLCDEIMDIQGIEPIEAEMEEVWHCPEGYIFKDENGNVINAKKIVLEKKNDVSLTQKQINTMIHDSCVLFCKHRGCGIPRDTCTSLGTCKEHDEYRESMRTYLEKHKR